MKYLSKAVALSGTLMLAGGLNAEPFTDADIEGSFYPYKNGTPTYQGYTPGIEVNQDNADQYKAIMDEALYRFVKDGWVTVKTAPTTDFPLTDDYVNATRQYAGNVTVNEKGTLDNYVAGRAFPKEPDSNDPKAGLKLVWNYQYGFNSGDSETIYPFW
ncbi:MAG: DUF1329 domain-containing protein, partial [Pseudomonadales bacterium]|nr:DUF1329 domain-containing protein [Pseudomonadales bacterium]